jgi:hypothetical protein
MKSGERLALAIVLTLGVVVGGTSAAAAYAWRRAGNVRIAIHESGPSGQDLSLSLPGLLVDSAIALCPMPGDPAVKARLKELGPALGAVASRLSTLPDVVLVDVRDDGGTIRVEKSGSDLIIRVVSREDRVEVAVPLESVRKLMQKFEA